MTQQTKTTGVLVTYYPDIPRITRVVDALYSQINDVVVVDNGSTGMKVQIEQAFTQLSASFIWFDENRGIAAALNAGIASAFDSGASHVLLLDQDSVPAINMVAKLHGVRELFSRTNKIGAVGPAIAEVNSSKQMPIVVSEGFVRHTIQADKEPVFCAHIITSGSLFDLKTFVETGPFDENLFIDFVDIEWCLRSHSFGFKSLTVPAAILYHALGDDVLEFWLFGWKRVNTHSPTRLYFISRNPWLILRNGSLPLSFRLAEVGRAALRLLIYPFLFPNKLETIQFMLKGTFHGLLGRTGGLPTDFVLKCR